jgi:acrylyl-CoA reductase (NADPH)
MVLGIDLAGTVEYSNSNAYKSGNRLVLNGWAAQRQHWGGLAQRARVRADWLIPVPSALTTRRAMVIGAAGGGRLGDS